MWLHPYDIVNSCLPFKGTDQVAPYLAENMMNVLSYSYFGRHQQLTSTQPVYLNRFFSV